MGSPGKEVERYQGNIFLPQPEFEPTEEEVIASDDFESRLSEGPAHGFEPPVPDISSIAIAIENGSYRIVPANETPRVAPRRHNIRRFHFNQLSRRTKISSGVITLALIGGGVRYQDNILAEAHKDDICVDSRISFPPQKIPLDDVELCVPSDGVFMDAENNVTALVEVHMDFGEGSPEIQTYGDITQTLGFPEDLQPPAELAAQSITNSAFLFEAMLFRSEENGGDVACAQDLADIAAHVKEKAPFYFEHQIGGSVQVTVEQIQSAENIRLISRLESGDGNSGRDIECA